MVTCEANDSVTIELPVGRLQFVPIPAASANRCVGMDLGRRGATRQNRQSRWDNRPSTETPVWRDALVSHSLDDDLPDGVERHGDEIATWPARDAVRTLEDETRLIPGDENTALTRPIVQCDLEDHILKRRKPGWQPIAGHIDDQRRVIPARPSVRSVRTDCSRSKITPRVRHRVCVRAS
jgi:hypothetical protein